MRTTLTLDDDALKIARRFAKGRRVSLGKAVSDLVRRTALQPRGARKVNGLSIFDLPEDSPTVTSEDVRRLLSEDP